ncbi:LOW QUALITY PROTEIN: hypothetical protein OSB04_002033 [Centaurea solstitialis]|uniref:AB hydrolase-1 domain-containing protein n=1 Tax=Centaurea solstitialis TaxID=347529 RepID=A0AA38UA61_9ASTR|nr:LOW QUALITY PROTEIN: hypothetical protein OSB04_002033 [Centaurea solstitialis]
MVGYIFALFFPEKLAGIITLGIPYMPPEALQQLQTLPEGFYMRRWQEPGRAEADFGRFDAKTVVRKIYILFSNSEVPIAGENQEILDLVEPSAPLPSWFTEEDLETYGASYAKSGFLTALQVPYRSLLERIAPPNHDPNAPIVVAPSLFITGEQDFFFNFPGMEEYLENGIKQFLPNLEIIYIPEASHFLPEQFPAKTNQLLLDFLKRNNYYRRAEAPLCRDWVGIIAGRAFLSRISRDLLHLAPSDDCRCKSRAIAPDYRGYGLSDVPAEPEKTSFADLVADTATILASLAISKVFVIGKDFGGMVGYIFTLFFPEKLAGIITLGIPYMPPEALQQLQTLPEGFYMRRWQEPGRAEADFGRFDAKTVVRKIYILFSNSEVPIAGENQEILDLVEPSAPLPSWFTEEDLETYGASYAKSGFLTALQVPYRSLLERIAPPNHDPNAPIVVAPSLFITGEQDFFFNFPGMEEYLENGIKQFLPNLEIIYIPEASHFLPEQFPPKLTNSSSIFSNATTTSASKIL